jgi:conjugal transfer pilus assembly protein TraW
MACILRWICSFQFIVLSVNASDLGSQGHTFPIEEVSLATYINEKLSRMSKTSLKAIETQICDHYMKCIAKPTPVKGLQKASVYREFFFDPAISVSTDIVDLENNAVIQKGTKINPLTLCSLNEELLFIDSTEEEQILWAKEQAENVKWILVKGNPLELEHKERRPVYFDQFGILTTKFGIKQIPARVSQEGLKLRIEEIPMEAT